MNDSNTPRDGDFANWVEGRSGVLKFELGDKFPVPPTVLQSPSVHVETSAQKLEEVLLAHEAPTQEFLDDLAALEQVPALSNEELARQAYEAGGADGESTIPQ